MRTATLILTFFCIALYIHDHFFIYSTSSRVSSVITFNLFLNISRRVPFSRHARLTVQIYFLVVFLVIPAVVQLERFYIIFFFLKRYFDFIFCPFVFCFLFPLDSAPEKCFTFTLPDGLRSISTETKQLLLGVYEPTADLKTNKIVVYICVPDNKGKKR